jgi:hypothetical protein
MPKKEKEPKIEAERETWSDFDHYQKVYKDVSAEIVYLTDDIEHEIQWLKQSGREIYRRLLCEYDTPDLIELRNTLERTRNLLRRQSYSVLYGSEYTKYYFGETSKDEPNS